MKVSMTRRDFLKTAGATSATVGFPMVFSGCATAYRANETVQIAANARLRLPRLAGR